MNSHLPAQSITIDLELGDEIHILRPSLQAMRTVNRIDNGFVGALRRIQQFDSEAMAAIIAAGTGATTRPALEAIERKVFECGLEPLAEPLTKFIVACMNGGREPVVAKPDADQD